MDVIHGDCACTYQNVHGCERGRDAPLDRGDGDARRARHGGDHPRRSRPRQAAQAVDLLGTVGADFPNLTPLVLGRGLSAADAHRLDVVASRVQQDGLLANIEIWDRSGRIVYSTLQSAEGTRPPKEPELVAALAGHSVTRTHNNELDPSSGKRTGVLDALHPLVSDRGVVYGALEVDLPLTAVRATAARAQRRRVLLVLAGGVLVGLLMAPLGVRLARSQAAAWIPGRRQTLREVREALDHGEIELVYQPQIEPAAAVSPGSRRSFAGAATDSWSGPTSSCRPSKSSAADVAADRPCP